MLRLFRRFNSEEDGATTVDWVLLTAGIMSLTLAVMGGFASGSKGVSKTLSSKVATETVTAAF